MGVDCSCLSLDWSLGGNQSLDKFGWLRPFILLFYGNHYFNRITGNINFTNYPLLQGMGNDK